MNLEQLINSIEQSPQIMQNIVKWETIPERKAMAGDYPKWIDARLVEILRNRGINQLYSHQISSCEAVKENKNVVVVTPTASGKTLCYNIPVLNSILKDYSTRALYLFPTKALSQDQLNELYELIGALDFGIKTYTYDGDTPVSARKTIRQAGHIVVTNPDMLHSGILPHHTGWVKLFENLKYVIIDEIHTYRGVFGSHFANVIRRLKRICEFYGSNPIFICSSATIANPDELTERLIEEKVELIDNNGSPSGEKHFLFYNPPVVNRELGIRKSSVLEARKLARLFLGNGIQTIIFARSRLLVEVLVTYLREDLKGGIQKKGTIKGYRGGYLPNQRREIEKGLRNKEILGVVSTNALELGIDVGNLDVSIICGYPGTISSTWQQAGRAGRRKGSSLSILVASSGALDQYIVNNPEYFLEQPPENGLINPNNLMILINHIKCAAFELPFVDGESFGVDTIHDTLSYLEYERILRHSGDRWYWMSESYPAEEISLRSASSQNFLIIDKTDNLTQVIGETDRFSAPMLIHKDAIYIHQGQQYQVEKLDFQDKKAYVRKVSVDYYTDANLEVELKVIDLFKEGLFDNSCRNYGEVMVNAMVTMFKKVKLNTHENLGYGSVDLPGIDMHTTSYWISLSGELYREMANDRLQDGLLGLSNVLVNVAPIYLMCDPRDINVVYHVKSPFTQKPTIYIYDSYPGGIGFSEKLYEVHFELFKKADSIIRKCECSYGCPSCVGPITEVGEKCKDITRKLLEVILKDAGY